MSEEEMIQNEWKKTRTELLELREGIWGVIKNAESAISAGSEHSEAFRFIAQELRELVE